MQLRAAFAAPLLCAAAGAAIAQAQLSISGLIDIGLYRDTNHMWQLGPIQRSNIAFGGVEDLGGGLVATFMLNQRFETDTGQLEQVGKPFFMPSPRSGSRAPSAACAWAARWTPCTARTGSSTPGATTTASPRRPGTSGTSTTPPIRRPIRGNPDFGRLTNGVFYDSRPASTALPCT